MLPGRLTCLLAMACLLLVASPACAADAPAEPRAFLPFLDYNTRIVLAGTAILGAASGLVGALMLLRKRALVSDVVSHAALPGICIAFLVAESVSPGSGKSLWPLFLGAVVAGGLGIVTLTVITRTTRLGEDAALGIVLSLFFGFGVVLLTVIQSLPTGNAAGLSEFIFGKAAAMVAGDVYAIAGVSLAALALCTLLYKEFILLCFDPGFARATGWPVTFLDLLLTSLVCVVVVVAMQSVGLLLVVALMVTPTSAARFWTNRLFPLIVIAAACGTLSCVAGVALSAWLPQLATGAVIVLCAAGFFIVSALFGSQHGLIGRWLQQRRYARSVQLDDLLRAIYESWEDRHETNAALSIDAAIPWSELAAEHAWTARWQRQSRRRAVRYELLRQDSAGQWRLTSAGVHQARAAVRRHRLWELYLMRYTEMPADVGDRNADFLEHALKASDVEELDALLNESNERPAVPINPHRAASSRASNPDISAESSSSG